ncbi:MAG: exodeoxyribonuclease III [Bernardetiaceae bacterium]
MQIITYNVNGIRAAMRKGFGDWLRATNPDILCLQETKAQKKQLGEEIAFFEQLGYHTYWHDAEKPGYSGVAIFTKTTPRNIVYGCGMTDYDREGRVIRADFVDLSVMSVYMPSGSSSPERQAFKFAWLDDFLPYLTELQAEIPALVVSGDYNICHLDIDIHNPSKQQKTSGFLPEERAWMDTFFGEAGFVDAFRYFNTDPHQYTWWSYRAGARAKNLGWRIDYHGITQPLAPRLRRSCILSQAKHSDHCPVLVQLDT